MAVGDKPCLVVGCEGKSDFTIIVSYDGAKLPIDVCAKHGDFFDTFDRTNHRVALFDNRQKEK